MVFLLMVAGIIAANLFGLRMFQINETKLNVTTWSRQTVEQITTEIHGCNTVSVGNITNGVFEGLLEWGDAAGQRLLIYPTTNTNNFTIYFVDPSDETFRRTVSQPRAPTPSSWPIRLPTPWYLAAQDFSGNVLTNNLKQPGDSPHP